MTPGTEGNKEQEQQTKSTEDNKEQLEATASFTLHQNLSKLRHKIDPVSVFIRTVMIIIIGHFTSFIYL